MQYAQYLLFLSIIAVLMAIYLLSEINSADRDDANEKKRRLRNLFSVQFGLLIIFLIGALSLVLMLSKGSELVLAPVSSAGWSTLNVKIGVSGFVAVLVFIALVGVYPLSYLAYRQVVSASQKKRLAEDFMLLGLHNRENAKREAEEQYELAYSPKQYIWYILLIMLISGLVMFGYALPNDSALCAIDKPVLLLVFYAYLGAYVFSIQELIRRFNTEDLRPQVYSSILMRMLVAMAIVFVGAQILIAAGQTLNAGGADTLTAAPEFWAAILAFLIGIFPKSGIEWFQKLARTTLSTPEEVNSLPIRNIQGISTWHEARLVEMGIDDVQNLATVDIRRVLLSTRFDIQEVINWIDQAILYAKVREKYPRFKDAAISTFHEFRLRLQQAQAPGSQRQGGTLHNDLQNLAVRLGLAVDEDLEYLADSTAYSNYAYISQYYRNTADLARTRGQAGRNELGGYLEGDSVEERRRYESLRDEYQSRIDQDPKDAASWANLGIIQFKLGDLIAALDSLKKAVELDEKLPVALANLAMICVLLGKWEDARNFATRSIDLDPFNKYPYRDRGRAFLELKEFDRAVDDLDQAILLDDHYGEAYYSRGIVQNLLGKFADAVVDLDLAYWLLNERSDPKFWLEWGTAYLGLANQKEKNSHGSGVSDYQTAIEKLTQSISRKDSVEAYWKRGLACSLMDCQEPAIRDLLKAIEIAERLNDPDIFKVRLLLGEMYWRGGRFTEACRLFKIIMEGAPLGSDLALKAADYLAKAQCSEAVQPLGGPTPPGGGPTPPVQKEEQTVETTAAAMSVPSEASGTSETFGSSLMNTLKQLDVEVIWTDRLEFYAKAVLGVDGVSLPPNKLKELADNIGVSPEQIERANLMTIPGIDVSSSALLIAADVRSITALSQMTADTLLASLTTVKETQNLEEPLPSLEQVQGWIVEAKQKAVPAL